MRVSRLGDTFIFSVRDPPSNIFNYISAEKLRKEHTVVAPLLGNDKEVVSVTVDELVFILGLQGFSPAGAREVFSTAEDHSFFLQLYEECMELCEAYKFLVDQGWKLRHAGRYGCHYLGYREAVHADALFIIGSMNLAPATRVAASTKKQLLVLIKTCGKDTMQFKVEKLL